MGKWAVVAICLLSANPAWAAFVTGQAYFDFSDGVKGGYVMGAFDAHLFTLPWLNQCTDGWKGGQLKAVFDKYLTDHPQNWNFAASSMLPYAIGSVCPSAPAEYKGK